MVRTRRETRSAAAAIDLRWRWFALASLLLLASAWILAAPAHAEKILRRGNLAEPYSLDPHHTTGLQEAAILGEILLGLYTEGQNGDPVLGAAESADTSPDGLKWTFKIRDHKWSDGSPVTSDDFLFTFQRIFNPSTAAEYVNVLYPIKNSEAIATNKLSMDKLGVSAPDPKTLIIELEHPAPYLPELLMHQTAFPIKRALFQKYGSEFTKPGKMLANGPYVLAEWRPHDHIKLVRNAQFYDAANVKIDAVYFYPIDDDLAALKKYRAGELDTQERFPIAMREWIKKNIPNEVHQATALWSQYMSFNSRRKPFDDVRVRKALAMAIDRKAIADEVLSGSYGEPANNVLPPGTANADRTGDLDWAGKTMDQRRAEAKNLLAAAGFGPGHPLHFSYYYSTNTDNRRIAVAMQSMWKDVGVEAEIEAHEAKVHQKLLQARDFDVAGDGWILDYNDAKNQLYLFQSSTSEMNYASYHSAAFDGLLVDADAEADKAARAKILGDASALLLKDMPVSPSFFPYQRQLVKPYVIGWVTNPRRINRTRWLDIADHVATTEGDISVGGASTSSEGGLWNWLGSWFSAEAWSKWWNS
jgi:oligopeptide transport system substrate-binding protein